MMEWLHILGETHPFHDIFIKVHLDIAVGAGLYPCSRSTVTILQTVGVWVSSANISTVDRNRIFEDELGEVVEVRH